MGFLHQPGDLARTPLAALLLEALNEKASGVLTVRHGGGASRLFLRAGMPVGAQVFVGFRPLGQHLLQSGLIDIQALGESLSEKARTGRSQGQILVEMGTISQETLERALSEQQTGYIGVVAALDEGAYEFDATAPVPDWTNGIRISPFKAIVEALEKPQAGPLVVSAIRQCGVGAIALAPFYGQLASSFGWSDAEGELVSRLSRPILLDAFFGDCPVAPERARAILAALVLLGLAEPAPAGSTDVPIGLTVDLADLLATPPTAPATPTATPTPSSTPSSTAFLTPTPSPISPPARRSDPEQARQRRQRLLSRAMQNMGIGPLSSPPPTAPAVPRSTEGGGDGPAGRVARPAPTAAEVSLRRALELVAPRAGEKDLFARLGIPKTSGRDEVKQAYLAIAKQFHPDRFLSPGLSDLAATVKELFAAVNEAYETLSDNKKRAEYLSRTIPGAAGKGDAGAEAASAARIDFQKGEACVKTRDFANARAFLEAAIRADPRAEYQAALAWCILSEPGAKDRGRAKELLEEAAKDPACDRALHLAGVLAREDKDEARAERMFRAAVRANPRNAEAQRELRQIEARRQTKGDERASLKK